MGRRKKDRIMAFEVLQPDTIHSSNGRICRNFVGYESDVRKLLEEEIRIPEKKNDKIIQKEFDIITGYQTEAREGMGNLGNDLISLLPIVLEKTVKTTTPYIYRIMDYGTGKLSQTFTTRKDAVSYIEKHIKTKTVIMHYNGKTDMQEFNQGYVDSILSTLEEDTIDFDVAQIGRGGEEGDIILLTIYKNKMT